MEDLVGTLTLCLIMIFLYSQGYVDAVWGATIVAFGMALLSSSAGLSCAT